MEKKVFFLSVLFLLLCFNGLYSDELQEIKALKINDKVKLDGKLDEPFWKDARTYGDFYVLRSDRKQCGDLTKFKIAYDNTWLYFGFECKNPGLQAIKPKARGNDRNAANDDSIEIFLGADGKTYFHYILAWGGGRREEKISCKNGKTVIDESRDLPWHYAVNIDKDRWSAEIALPIYLIFSRVNPDEIKLNVCRNMRIPDIDGSAVIVGEARECYSWRPVLNIFYEPERFSLLRKFASDNVRIPALCVFEKPKLSGYYTKEGKTFYDVKTMVKGLNKQSTVLQISVEDCAADGERTIVSRDLKMSGKDQQEIIISVPVKAVSDREIKLSMRDSVTGGIMQHWEIEDKSTLDLMSAYLDRNYYTDEDEAVIIYASGLPEDFLRECEIMVKDESGKFYLRNNALKMKGRIPLPLKEFSAGKTRLNIELRKNAKSICSMDFILSKRLPKPGCEWKIDRERRVILNNGIPFFPFGIIVHNIMPDDETLFRELAGAGFNILPCWQKVDDPAVLKFYGEQCQKYNLLFMPFIDDMCFTTEPVDILSKFFKGKELQNLQGTFSKASITNKKVAMICNPYLKALMTEQRYEIFDEIYKKLLPQVMKGVDACKDSPSLSAYFMFDEPQEDVWFRQSEFGKKLYDEINERDGYHPVAINYSSYIPQGEQYTDFMDILMTDPYWIPDGNKGRNTPDFVSKIVYETDLRAQRKRLVTWIVPLAEYWSGCRKRPILPEEQHVQTWLSIIHGAKGLIYYAYKVHNPENWNALKELASQMKTLGPSIVAVEIPQQIRYFDAVDKCDFQEIYLSSEKNVYPDVQVRLLKGSTEGDFILMAANSKKYPVAVKYEVKGLDCGVKNIFGDSSLDITEDSFAEKLKAYETRAYKIKLKETVEGGSVSIKVYTRHMSSDVKMEEAAYHNNVRNGKKNILPNPSFEISSVYNWADYYNQFSGGMTPAVLLQEGGFFGKKCFMLEKNGSNSSSVWTYCAPQNDKSERYVFSFYARGNVTGLKIWARGFQYDHIKKNEQTFILTDEWKRYSFSGEIPAHCDSRTKYEIRLISEGKVWIDGLQLEKGSMPTEFEE